jgi:hypothetical protein
MMMMKKLLGVAIAATGCLMLAQVASALSCTGFSGTIQGATGTVTGNTCQAGGTTLATACTNGDFLNGAGVAIYQVDVGLTNGYTLTVTSAAFIPWLGYMGSPCADSTTCIDDVTIGTPGTISTAAHTNGDTPGGTYYLIVGDVSADGPGCGAFSVTWGQNLPVQLQDFSVG